MVDKKFIISLQGKEFVTFEGLLDEFHKNDGESIHTGLLSMDPLIVQATVKGKKGEFQGIGDASDDNVNKLIAKHKIRMAETRAIARALRWYNNVGMCSADELGGDGEIAGAKTTEKTAEKPKENTGTDHTCTKCGNGISEKVNDYSIDHFEKPLCMACQKNE